MSAKIFYSVLLMMFTGVASAALGEESPPVEDTNIVLLQANTPLGETQIGLVKGFIETTLSLSLSLNASKAGKGAYRYTASRSIAVSEQQLIENTLPATYEVRVSFPVDTTDYDPRPDEGGGGGSSLSKGKTKRK